MVFAINAPEEGDKTYSTFKEKAKAANHPNPADRATADFTPPGAQGSAPPAGTDAPPSESSAGTDVPPSESSAGTDIPPSESSAGAPDTASPTIDSAQSTGSASVVGPTAVPSADQANVAPSSSTALTRSGALSAVQVPGAGIALTLAGLLAGMLL